MNKKVKAPLLGKPNPDVVKMILILCLAGLSLALFTALTPPVFTDPLFGEAGFWAGLEGDLGVYLSRFLLSLVLLGLLPFVISLVLRYKPTQLGLRLPAPFLRWYHWAGLVAAGLVIGATGAFSQDLASYYPYSKTLIAQVGRDGAAPLLLHYALYFFLYYIPWEFFFRGFLIFPFLMLMAKPGRPSPGHSAQPDTRQAALIALLVSFQTIPSVMLHFGHPLSELLSAIPAGLAFGFLTWKTRSIIPGLVVHALIGMTLDTVIVLRSLGVL